MQRVFLKILYYFLQNLSNDEYGDNCIIKIENVWNDGRVNSRTAKNLFIEMILSLLICIAYHILSKISFMCTKCYKEIAKLMVNEY